MDLLELVNRDIEKAGGIAKYYAAVIEELYPQPFIYRRKNMAVTKYRFTTEYLKKNCDLKSLKQMAIELGLPISEVTRRLKQLGIKKKRKFPLHKRETCIILNMENGIFYLTGLQAALAMKYPVRTLMRHLITKGEFKTLKLV